MSGNRRSDDVEMNSKYNSSTSSTSSASSEDEPPTYKEVVQSKKQSKWQPKPLKSKKRQASPGERLP